MSTPLFLLLGLTIATCVIAYWSDNLGKKLGKKRVTLFGLRPRQTATLMTMTSSVVIMLFTFGALLATNSGLRNALLRYDTERADNLKLRESNKELRSEQKTLQDEVTTAQKQAINAKNQASSAKTQAAEAKKQAAEAHTNYQAALGQLKDKQAKLRSAQNAERAARSGETQARQGEKTARERARQANLDLQEKQAELGKVNQSLKTAQTDLQTLQARLKKAQEDVRVAQEKLAQEQNKVAREQGRFIKAAADSLKFQEDLFKQINQRQQEIENLKIQKTGLGQEIQELNDNVKRLNDDVKRLKLLQIQLAQPSNREVDVAVGAVFADRLIPPRNSPTETAVQLRAMLAEGREEVAKTNKERTLKLLVKTGEELPEEIIVKSLSQFLGNLTTPASVRLSALRIHAKDETEIQCAFLVVPARVAFARDEVMAAKVIDGSQGDARIFSQLWRQLLDVGATEASKRGVLPILRGDEKLYVDGTNERLFEALRRIQALGKPVEVRLLADDDLTTIDQLRVHFQVGKPESNKATGSL